MSFLSADSIKLIGEFAGISNLKDDVALALAQDIEYRLRDIIQEAMKFMRHAKRTRLTTDDINHALQVRNVERLYGFNTNAPLKFKAVNSSSIGQIFYVEDDEVDFDDILNAPLPKVPAEVTYTAHWLAVEGVQPTIPQNPAPLENRIDSLSKRLKAEGKFDFLDNRTEVKPLVRHVLSKELQIYYEKIVEALLSPAVDLQEAALESIHEDNGIQQLLPYFIQFVTEQIASNLKNLPLLRVMTRVLEGVMVNKHFFIEPYLHQLMPPILSCLVSKRLCQDPNEDHWSLRVFAARLMGSICSKYGQAYQTLQPRVTRTLLRAFLDPLRALTTHYGAIIGLTALGPEVVRALVIPNMKSYLAMLQPVLDGKGTQEGTNPEIAKMEAQRCKNALRDSMIVFLKHEARKLQGKNMAAESDMVVDQMQIDWTKIDHLDEIVELFGEDIKQTV